MWSNGSDCNPRKHPLGREPDEGPKHDEMQDIVMISSGDFTRILLGERKCCADWVSHNLSEGDRSGIGWTSAPKCLENFGGGRSTLVWDNATGGKRCQYQYDPDTKQKSAEWVFSVKWSLRITKVFPNKCLFICNIGQVASKPPEGRKMVTDDWYVNQCLPKES